MLFIIVHCSSEDGIPLGSNILETIHYKYSSYDSATSCQLTKSSKNLFPV